MRITASSRGQIVLPAEIRKMDGIRPGQKFDMERLNEGDYRLVRRARPLKQGAVDWLSACPADARPARH
jgi:AbrB family looped-hinge helix DNA binding protein